MKVVRNIILFACVLFVAPAINASLAETVRSNPELLRAFRVLWGDTVESKVDVVDTQVTLLGGTFLTSSLISTGTITLSTAGNYALGEDITADIEIAASSISLDLNDRCLTGMIIVDASGSDITDIEIRNGSVLPPAPFSAPIAGITVASEVMRAQIFDVVMECSNTTASSVKGRSCMEIAGDDVLITNCHLTAGDSGDGDTFDGGDGIELTSTSTYAVIKDCTFFTGDGGASGFIGTAGRGGHGIFVNGASNATIADCLVFITGAGGTNSNGDGGDGGDGVRITSASADIDLQDCTIRNTGAGGTATGTDGTAGKAVDDAVSGSDPGKSIILSNVGHNIANTTTRFRIGGTGGTEEGVALTYPPTTTAVNVHANVFIT